MVGTGELGERTAPPEVFDARRLAAVRRTQLLDTGAEEPFDRLSTLAATLLDAPFAFITIVDDQRSFWKSCIGVPLADPTDLAQRQNLVEESFCQYVIGSHEPLIVGDAAADPRTRDNPSIASMGVAAWAGYPVHSPGGEVLGTFCVVDTVVREWTERDVAVLETLSHAASGEIALRIALDEAHTASLEALTFGEANAELARTLQESLLPSRLLDVPGLDLAARYRSGSTEVRVIGDFYDVVHAEGDRWGVVIGDVCGHGAQAAALTAMARYTVSSLAPRESSPSAVLRQLNTLVHERATASEDDRFLTAAYLTLSPTSWGTFEGQVCTAGHPPVLRRGADGSVEALGSTGTLLGPLVEPRLTDDRFELAPGETLVLYTDGVTEARPGRGTEEFGEQRLRSVIARAGGDADAATLADAVEAAVVAHSGGHVMDDVAILVVRSPAPPVVPTG